MNSQVHQFALVPPPLAQARTRRTRPYSIRVLVVILISAFSVQAQTYLKRVLFYGPTVSDQTATGAEIAFINNHPGEFQPVDPNDLTAPGKSQVWNEQQWIDASLADFQQFDAIVISDLGFPDSVFPQWNAAVATRAIWGSAINGNILISSGDPVADVISGGHPVEVLRIFRQGLRYAASQAGNSHGRTGLYIATDHLLPGEYLGNVQNPTEIELLSWFGSFRAVTANEFTPQRLVMQNPILNVMEGGIASWLDRFEPGFHSWPNGFFPVAYRTFDNNSTPTNSPGYFVSYEHTDGYESCTGLRPLVTILVKPVNGSELTRLMASQYNIAKPATVGQTVTFSAYSMFAALMDPNAVGPNTQVSWRVISGPNDDLHGKCVRQLSQGQIPTSIWNGSYNHQGGVGQDVVQLFVDYDGDEVFDDMANNNNCPTDCEDPAPGVTIEFDTTFTVNWGAPQITLAKLASPAAALEPPNASTPGTSAFFRVTRTGAWASPIVVSACVRVNPFSAVGLATPSIDYEIKINGTPQSLSSGVFSFTLPAGSTSTSVDVEVSPLHDLIAEGPESVRIALKDATDGSYVVGGLGAPGNGFAELTINDNDQPVVTVTTPTAAFENDSQNSGAWVVSATSLSVPVDVFMKLSGSSTHEVDYLTDANISQFGTVIVPLDPASGGQATVQLIPFQDSRTEGTESATLTLITHPTYKNGSPSAASVNITDDDSPKIPANGYTITDLGDAGHSSTFAAGINHNSPAQIAGSFTPTGSPGGTFRAFRWENGVFSDIPQVVDSMDWMAANTINDNGWVVGVGNSPTTLVNYFWRWDGANIITLQTPTSNIDLNQGPRGINDANWIVGAAKNDIGVYRAALWDVSGNWFELSGLNPAPEFSSHAWALSSSTTGHRLVGESRIVILNGTAETSAFHAFRTQSGSTPNQITLSDDLGNALVNETSSSGGYAVNSFWEIAGYSAVSPSEQRAAYKDGNSGKNKGWRTLGVLSGGSGAGLSAQALGMNDFGLIVGWSRTTTSGNGNPKAVVWENYQSPTASDLNLKIPVADRPNWELQYATGINAPGKIIGSGLKNGIQRAFLLTPIP